MQIETDAAVMLHKKSVCAQAITLLEQRRALEAHRGCGISVCIAQQYFLFPFLFCLLYYFFLLLIVFSLVAVVMEECHISL